MPDKNKNFIYLLWDIIKTKHDILKQYDEETQTVPYFELYKWITEILSFGILFTVVYLDIFILTGWLKWLMMPFALGAIRWLWLDIVGTTADQIKGKK